MQEGDEVVPYFMDDPQDHQNMTGTFNVDDENQNDFNMGDDENDNQFQEIVDDTMGCGMATFGLQNDLTDRDQMILDEGCLMNEGSDKQNDSNGAVPFGELDEDEVDIDKLIAEQDRAAKALEEKEVQDPKSGSQNAANPDQDIHQKS